MKMLIDMYSNLTSSRFRGIGRYEIALYEALYKTKGVNKLIPVANGNYETFEELRQKIYRISPDIPLRPYYYPKRSELSMGVSAHVEISMNLVNHTYNLISPDVILAPVFEEWNEGIIPPADQFHSNVKRITILYDLIPYLFSKQYLDYNAKFKNWYIERLFSHRNHELILAISESTRQDAIKHLGINEEKVVNILAGVDPMFRKISFSKQEKKSRLSEIGISRPFIMYIGGDNFRKNMIGALEAYANLPRSITQNHQLVLNDVGDHSDFLDKAKSLGLSKNDVVIFDRISDDQLIGLYNLAKLCFFPSLYEGFGFPILEAMSCGAPVIASDNSSLPEVLGRSDAMFDASNINSISAKLHQAIEDERFRKDLSAYGLKRAKIFTWEKSAKIAWEAIESLNIKERGFVRVANSKKKIAFVSPLPPQNSGIADYSNDLLPYLADYYAIDLFSDIKSERVGSDLSNNFKIFHWSELLSRKDNYAAVLYQMGNSEFHTYMYDLLPKFPGIVMLHDFFMSGLVWCREHIDGIKSALKSEIDFSHGVRGLVELARFDQGHSIIQWPMNRKIIHYASELIVHSEYFFTLYNQYYGETWRPRTSVIKHIGKISARLSKSEKETIRTKLGINPSAVVVSSFGITSPSKLNHLAIQAISELTLDDERELNLFLVGKMDGGEYGGKIIRMIKDYAGNNYINITGHVSSEEYEDYLISTDIAIQLRTTSRGETSGAVIDCLSHGIPTILNSYAAFNDYSNKVVVKISEKPNVNEIKTALLNLIENPERIAALRNKATRLIDDEHNPKIIF